MDNLKDRQDSTYKRINIWGGDKENSKKYWRKYNRIFNFGYEKCELGRDFSDVNEYINNNYEF